MKTLALTVAVLIVTIGVLLGVVLAGLAFLFRRELAGRGHGGPFACRRCGACCRLRVHLTRADIVRLQEGGLDQAVFAERKFGFRFLRKSDAGDCLFLDKAHDGGDCHCRVYDLRPGVCRRFPKVSIWGLRWLDRRCPATRGKRG